MFEAVWEFLRAHWIWFSFLTIGGFVYMSIGYLLFLAKLKVAKGHIRYHSDTYVYSIVPGFWTYIFFPQISFPRLAGKEQTLDYEEISPVARYLTHPEENSHYPYFIVFFWPYMPVWIIGYMMINVVILLCSFLFYLTWNLIVGLIRLIFNFFTLPIRKFLLKLSKLSEGQQ